MFSGKKGKFGYLKKQPIKIGLFTLLIIAGCAGIFWIGYILTDTNKNIFTLAAVLGMLPAAKLIVSFIMYLKAEKFAISKTLYDKYEDLLKDTKLKYGFDLYLTSEKYNFPVSVCVIADKSIFLYLNSPKADVNKCKEHVDKYLNNNKIQGYKVYPFSDEAKFYDRIKNVCEKYEFDENDIAPFELIKNLAL